MTLTTFTNAPAGTGEARSKDRGVMKTSSDITESVVIGVVLVVAILTGGFLCTRDKGNATRCGSACFPTPMKSFDPSTGVCECAK